MRVKRSWAVCFLGMLLAIASRAQFTPEQTATLYVHGFDPDGVNTQGVVGQDETDTVLERLAALAGVPVGVSEPLAPNQLTMTHYYGDVYPSYYAPEDIAEVEAVTAQWNGGIPRYALIVAKYAREVMRRSGAQQVNLVGASMGALVTRYLVEKDLEGLAGEGKIGRWLTINGVVAGNWAVSSSLSEAFEDYFNNLGLPEVDLEHMSYDWIDHNLHDPRTEADNPLLSKILVGHWTSTDDNEFNHTLTLSSRKPNDGVQLHEDTYFHSITERSLFQGQLPAHGWTHDTHYTIQDDPGAHFGVMAFIFGTRRARIRLVEVEVSDIYEGLLGGDEGEVVFESRVYSPLAEGQFGITRPINAMTHRGGNAPLQRCEEDRTYSDLDLAVFDNLLLAGETQFRVYLGARELDFDVFYGVEENPFDEYEQMGQTEIMVSLEDEGTYPFATEDWRGVVEVELFNYTTQPPNFDLNGDSLVDYEDIFALAARWLESGTGDFDWSGVVGHEDVYALSQALRSAP